jgi:UDP-N-acetylglucosamine--N-acetylmuramyl-(pentapeptide) pyrophosphoryl-undecaprenol N-acetylglucosamine transferase
MKGAPVRVLVSGGGTAGHIYPALTVAELVSADARDRVAYVGAPNSLEQRLAGERGVEFVSVPARGWDRARPVTLLTGFATAAVSTVRCVHLLRRDRTDAVAGFGGYVSVPLSLAAVICRVPLVLHEQNSVPGVANRILARFARSVCVTYEDSVPLLPHPERAVVTGDPVRESVLRADRDAGREALGIAPDETLLLVFGGSRGARHVNGALLALRERLEDVDCLRVVQIAGPLEAADVRAALEAHSGGIPAWWQVLEYVAEMGDLLAAADLVVCRAGATTLAEISVLGKASVLVPYPYATDDHQTLNAGPFLRAGASLVVADADLDGPALWEALAKLLANPAARAAMASAAASLGRPDAARAVVRALTAAAERREVA